MNLIKSRQFITDDQIAIPWIVHRGVQRIKPDRLYAYILQIWPNSRTFNLCVDIMDLSREYGSDILRRLG